MRKLFFFLVLLSFIFSSCNSNTTQEQQNIVKTNGEESGIEPVVWISAKEWEVVNSENQTSYSEIQSSSSTDF